MQWNAEKEAKLRMMWANGATMLQIAAELGCKRGAVSGKIRRLGLTLAKIRTRVIRPRRSRSFPVPLLGLTNNTCRWPMGDVGTKEFRFCGAPDADMASSMPYCHFHRKIAYNSNMRRVR